MSVRSSKDADMLANNIYQVTIWLSVTDARAVRCAATELAEAMETPRWSLPSSIRDHLLTLLDPGALPGIEILGTVVNALGRTSDSEALEREEKARSRPEQLDTSDQHGQPS